ncbi:MAG: FadD3 family acyl-CoA ligase [Streptosporangiales bacterium]|nr:FadD3 family acyl-CoA ligase [Streptosporangiales bacterium]
MSAAGSFNGPPTVPAAVRRAASLWPDAEAIVDGDQRVTFAELATEMTRAARAFAASGVRPGDRVAVWAPNSLSWIIASFGIYAAGAVMVPINTRFKGAEAAHVLRTSGARMLLTVTDFLGADYAGMLSADDAALREELEIVVLSGDPGDGVSWSSFLARAAGGGPLDAETALGPDDSSDIIFTSGTTGTPKGAMLTHGASTRTYVAWAETVGLREGDRYACVYPFFHTAGLKSGILASVLVGATLVPCPVFEVDTVMALVAKERITMLPGPPALYQSLLNADLSGYDSSSLRLAVTGAASVPVDLVRRIRTDLGFESVVTGYGLTETTGTVSMCRHDDPVEVIANTCGRPIPGVSVRVVDSSGADAPPGEPGEVWAKGYNVMSGYFSNPEATAEAITPDGWLRTGDVGVLDSAGNLKITDRIKDMFIVGGFNAYPAEIENLLSRHPAVAQVAVVGVPDERLGEVGYAYVIPRADTAVPSADELIAWCRNEMANFKVPRHVSFVEALPLNPSGKVLKFELRDRARKAVAR